MQQFGKPNAAGLASLPEHLVHTVRVIPNRFMRTRDCLVLNWSYWSVDWLRPIRQVELAKTGDAEKRMMLGEYTLSAKNEASSGGVFDLTVP
jgi:hypothetical protein